MTKFYKDVEGKHAVKKNTPRWEPPPHWVSQLGVCAVTEFPRYPEIVVSLVLMQFLTSCLGLFEYDFPKGWKGYPALYSYGECL